jgi:hypothetical protein
MPSVMVFAAIVAISRLYEVRHAQRLSHLRMAEAQARSEVGILLALAAP